MKDRPSQGNPHVQLTLGPVIQSFRPERKNKSQTQMQTAINAQQIRRKNTKSKKKQCETHWKIKASRHTTLPKLFANRFLYFVLNSQFTICPQIGLGKVDEEEETQDYNTDFLRASSGWSLELYNYILHNCLDNCLS